MLAAGWKILVGVGVTALGVFGIVRHEKAKANHVVQGLKSTDPVTGAGHVVIVPVHGFGLPNPPPRVISPSGDAPTKISTVSDVQKALNYLNFANPPLSITNIVDSSTEKAIKSFQQSENAQVTSYPDIPTMLLLEVAVLKKAGTNGQVGSGILTGKNPDKSNPLVSSNKDVQRALNLLGASPKLVEDGSIGPKTEAATKAFQIVHGLSADGIPGPVTKNALAEALTIAGYTEASMA